MIVTDELKIPKAVRKSVYLFYVQAWPKQFSCFPVVLVLTFASAYGFWPLQLRQNAWRVRIWTFLTASNGSNIPKSVRVIVCHFSAQACDFGICDFPSPMMLTFASAYEFTAVQLRESGSWLRFWASQILSIG